jgi:hypothetical protein
VTATADYDWGDGIMLDSIQPGDILQFRKHVVHTQTFTYANDEWHETKTQTLTRPHHTAIVIAVHPDGSVTVVEQNVYPDPKKVTRSVIPRLDAGEQTKRIDSEHRVKMTVTGAVRAYRPAPKAPKDASLLHPGRSAPAGGPRMAVNGVAPSEGGAKRMPAPLGMQVRRGSGRSA